MPTREYIVRIKRKIGKSFVDLPKSDQEKLKLLILELKEKGPIRSKWPKFSSLDGKRSKATKRRYHCHLSYSWVACWTHEKKTIEIEVTYAGSRENAPY